MSKNIPDNVRDALLTIGRYCRSRDCVDCAFAQKAGSKCVFEQEHNPCWLIEDTLGYSGVEELYSRTKEDQ